MATPQSNLRATPFTEVLGAVAPQRDPPWGRFLFRPPELTNARLIFDPQPFRTHEFVPSKSARPRVRR